MTSIRKITFLLFLFITKCCMAQVIKPTFSSVKNAGGYSLGKITEMAQDRHGYMWFVDQSGNSVIQYDGYRMKIFRNEPADSNSLGSLRLESIAADAAGNIWIGMPYGVDKYDDVSGKFIHYRIFLGGQVSATALLIDHSGLVWFGSNNGLAMFDPATGKFTVFLHSENDLSTISCNIIRCLYEDKAGVLWVGTGFPFDNNLNDGGLNRFNRDKLTFTRYRHDDNNPASIAGNKVRGILEDSKGNFWVGTNLDGLQLMNRQNGTFEHLSYDPQHPEKLSRPPIPKGNNFDHITFIKEDVLGKIWIGTYAAGIMRYDPATKTTEHYDSSDKKRPGGYTDNSSWNCYMSRDGTVWITNEIAQLFRVDPYQTGFSEMKFNGSGDSFFEDSAGNLWVCGTSGGLLMINTETDATKVFRHDPDDSLTLSSSGIGRIIPRTDGQWWLTSSNGLNIFDPKTGKNKRLFYTPDADTSHAKNVSLSLLETEDQTYIGWLGCRLTAIDKKTGNITDYVHNPADTTSLSWGPPGSFGAVVDLLKNADGTIWVSVWNADGAALELFNPQTKKFKHYLKGLIVGDMLRSSSGRLWVATSLGLYYRVDSLDAFIPVGPENSDFRKSRVKSLVEDADHNIWGIDGLGIFRYNVKKDELHLFGEKSGVFAVTYFNYVGSGSTSKGELLFGNPNGFYKCFPAAVVNEVDPIAMITDFKLDGQSINSTHEIRLDTSIEDIKEITLSHSQNIFSIDFTALHFSSPEDNTIQYILEGYENKWRSATGEKSAYYLNVPTGSYKFRLKVVSSYGTKAEKVLLVTVLPPWWQTWWFRTLEILLAIALIYAFVQYRSHNLKQRNLVLEKKVQQRTNELNQSLADLKTTQDQLIQSEKMASLGELTAGIAHEIKNPLNFIRNFSEINLDIVSEIEEVQNPETYTNDLKTLKKNLEKINHHGKRIDGIVNGMLQHSRLGNMNKEPVNINTLCDESLKLAYHGFRAKEKTFTAHYETQFEEGLPNVMVIPQDLGRVLLNLFNNAFYTVNEKNKRYVSESADEAIQAELLYKPLVIVNTKRSGQKILITISDNGMGIAPNIINKVFQPFFTTKPTGEGTGLGLSMSYDIIVKSHGGELHVKSKEGIGTDFEIILPLT